MVSQHPVVGVSVEQYPAIFGDKSTVGDSLGERRMVWSRTPHVHHLIDRDPCSWKTLCHRGPVALDHHHPAVPKENSTLVVGAVNFETLFARKVDMSVVCSPNERHVVRQPF